MFGACGRRFLHLWPVDSASLIHMRGFSPKPELEIGGIYRDIDGSLVHLLAVQREICCWTPMGCTSDASQMTHRDNFIRRFVAAYPAPVRRRAPRAKQPRQMSETVRVSEAA